MLECEIHEKEADWWEMKQMVALVLQANQLLQLLKRVSPSMSVRSVYESLSSISASVAEFEIQIRRL